MRQRSSSQRLSWMVAVWMLVCVGAFLLSLRVRSRDWKVTAAPAQRGAAATTVLPL